MSKKTSLLVTSLLVLLAWATALHAETEPVRLFEIAITRFSLRPDGEAWAEHGLLDARGGYRKTDEARVLSIVTVPPAARDKRLIKLDAWLAYVRLGPKATANFVADTEGEQYMIGERIYIAIAPSADPSLDNGQLINLSTRGHASASEKLIGGFVVDQQHRRVLVRAVGPGLAAFGVGNAMSDPFVTIFRGSLPVHFNGDWSGRPDAAEIAAAATSVGAFPLGNGSKDAALLVELPPGNYTAQVEPESGAAGTVLLEIYRVP